MAAIERSDASVEEAICFLQFSRACASCSTEHDFQSLVRTFARLLLPHVALLAVVGRVDLQHLEMRAVVAVDHPAEHLATLAPVMATRDRPVVDHWLRHMQPLVLQLPDDAPLMSPREVDEIQTYRLGRLGIHGVIDIEARTGIYL